MFESTSSTSGQSQSIEAFAQWRIIQAISKLIKSRRPGILFLFIYFFFSGIAYDIIYQSYILSNESSIYDASLVIIAKIWDGRFYSISNGFHSYFVVIV